MRPTSQTLGHSFRISSDSGTRFLARRDHKDEHLRKAILRRAISALVVSTATRMIGFTQTARFDFVEPAKQQTHLGSDALIRFGDFDTDRNYLEPKTGIESFTMPVAAVVGVSK